MSFKSLAINQIVRMMMYLICCLLCSCAEFDATNPNDYIGPVSPEPNTLPALVPEGNTVSAPLLPTTSKTLPDNGPLNITITQAVLLALENNTSLVVQRFNPQIKRTLEQQALAIFDPDLTGEFADEHTKVMTGPIKSRSNDSSMTVGIQEFFPTGTTLGITGNTGAY